MIHRLKTTMASSLDAAEDLINTLMYHSGYPPLTLDDARFIAKSATDSFECFARAIA